MLKDKVILVTGAGRGLGRGIAEAIAEAGGQVVVTDVRQRDAEETAEILGDHDCLPLAVDVTDDSSIKKGIDQSVERFGRLDGWVNNAGVITMEPAFETSRDGWSRHFDVT